MATLSRIPVLWTGLTALPGLSVFYCDSGVDVITELKNWFTALAPLFPLNLSWNVPNSGDTINDATGAINGGWSSALAYTIAASGAVTHAAGCGGYVKWGTAAIVNGRRLKGRTFLAPISIGYYDSNGTLTSVFLTTAGPATQTLVTAGKLKVWHRPAPGGGGGGSSSLITTQFIPDQVTSLRSRRI